MDEEFIDEENPYEESGRESQVESEGISGAEAGFIEGFEQDSQEEDDLNLDEDERLED
ncbi:MAG: hypothetical protein ACMXYF_05100 [Candidatus Woesearchaeota archaeon]